MVGPFSNKSRYRAGQSAALVLLAFLAFGDVTAHAAKKKRTANEQYSSLEAEGGDAPETRPLLMPSGSTSSNSEFAGPAYAPPTAYARPLLAVVPPTEESSDDAAMGADVPLPLPPPPTLVEMHAAAQVPAAIPPPPPQAQPRGYQTFAPAAPRAAQLEAVPFDPVPPSQKTAIRKRIKLVDRMILKYGRAYDYRTHTLRQLEAISAELDEEAKQQALRNR